MRFLLSFLAMLVLVAATTAQDVAPEEQELRQMWRRFEEFYNNRDAEGVASLYAPDADRTNAQGEVAHGRREIQEMYAASMRQQAAGNVDNRIGPITIRLLRPDVAILDGDGDFVTPSGRSKYFFTVIATKESGRWLIAAGRPRGTVQQAQN